MFSNGILPMIVWSYILLCAFGMARSVKAVATALHELKVSVCYKSGMVSGSGSMLGMRTFKMCVCDGFRFVFVRLQ